MLFNFNIPLYFEGCLANGVFDRCLKLINNKSRVLVKLKYKIILIILIILIVATISYYGWYETIVIISNSVKFLFKILLWLVAIVMVITFVILSFRREQIKRTRPELLQFLNYTSITLITLCNIYVILVLAFAPRNFKNYEDIYLYTLRDIVSFEKPFIVKIPSDLLSSNGLYYSEDIKNYDEYKKFKLQNTPTYVNDENPSDEFHLYEGANYYAKSEDEIEAEIEEERYSDAMMSDGGNDYSDPGVHEVSGYSRSDGTYVESYERTNPDGVEENNFSYDGR